MYLIVCIRELRSGGAHGDSTRDWSSGPAKRCGRHGRMPGEGPRPRRGSGCSSRSRSGYDERSILTQVRRARRGAGIGPRRFAQTQTGAPRTVADNHAFDIVSEINTAEMHNAVVQAQHEIAVRYDFKGTKASIDYNKKDNTLTLLADH